MRIVVQFLATSLLLLTFPLLHAESFDVKSTAVNGNGSYVGAGVGLFNLKLENFDDVAATSIARADDHAWTVFGGYRFNPYLSIEGAYIDFGEPSATYQALASSGTYRVKMSGIAPNVVGILPLGRAELFAKAGYYFYRMRSRITTSTGAVIESNHNRADFLYGGGAGFNLSTHFNARVEYERLHLKDANSSDAFWLSAQWHF